MKKIIFSILFTLSFCLAYTQTFQGIRAGLYRGQLDNFQKGEVSVWINVDEENQTLEYKTRADQKSSNFKIVETTKNYYLLRASGFKGIYIPKEDQLFTWTDKTISAYGIGYDIMKERLEKIYSSSKAGLNISEIGVLVYSIK